MSATKNRETCPATLRVIFQAADSDGRTPQLILCEKRGHLEGTLISVLNKNVSKLFVNFQANFASESPKK